MNFSIREIVFVIVICALAVGWYLDRHSITQMKATQQTQAAMSAGAAEQEQEKKKLRALGREYLDKVAHYQDELDKLEKEKTALGLGETQ